MGHDFDNDDAVCHCGQRWTSHQSTPTPCKAASPATSEAPKSPYWSKHRKGESHLDGLRKLLGLSIPSVAEASGVSTRTAGRVLSGRVGDGHGMTSIAAAKRVEKTVRDMAASLQYEDWG